MNSEVTIAVITLIGSVIGHFVQYYSKRRIQRGIEFPIEIPAGSKRNSIILIGLGGTGKTTFINSLLGTAIPIKKTHRYVLYRGEAQIPNVTPEGTNGHTRYHMFISDYVGQNIGTLVSSFIWQQKKAFSPVSFGYINALVIMVDLVGPESRNPEKPDTQRINAHLEQWNETALDAVWGLLRPESLKYVCLFINKLDSMEDGSNAAKAAYQERFSGLEKRIRDRLKPETTGIEFEIVIGSTRQGIAQVQQKLVRHSVDADDLPEIKEESEVIGAA